MNTAGILLGLPVGYAFSRYITWAVATEATRLPFIIHSSSWLLTIMLGYVFTLVGYLPILRAVRQMDWLDALNVKE